MDKDKLTRIITATLGWGIIAVVGSAFVFYMIVGFLITSDINKTVQAPKKAQKAAERIEHYLEEKYDEEFTVQTGAEWIAWSEQTRTVLHIADTWTRRL